MKLKLIECPRCGKDVRIIKLRGRKHCKNCNYYFTLKTIRWKKYRRKKIGGFLNNIWIERLPPNKNYPPNNPNRKLWEYIARVKNEGGLVVYEKIIPKTVHVDPVMKTWDKKEFYGSVLTKVERKEYHYNIDISGSNALEKKAEYWRWIINYYLRNLHNIGGGTFKVVNIIGKNGAEEIFRREF